ncbi:MAG: heparinase II/III domain-containing protein, partial [Thermocrispum sp.]
ADQSVSGGPFLWTGHANTRVLAADVGADGGRWQAAHDGYASRDRPVLHRRTVELDGALRELHILDEVRSPRAHRCTLAFHLGPSITAELVGDTAWLSWPHRSRPDHRHTAVLALPADLDWTAHRGETDPPLGWYSPGFGRREPATTLLGAGRSSGVGGVTAFATLLRFTS